MRTNLLALTLMAAVAAHAVPAAAQDPDFRWRGTIPEGRTIEIQGLNGQIRAVASSDDAVHVVATRQARRSDPESVRIEVVPHDGGVTICAVYPTPRGARQENECRPGGGRNSNRDNDVQVNFEVRVPAGVRFAGNTVNGGIKAEGLRSNLKATTVNGSVDIATSGLAEATTVNGNITCRVGSNQLASNLSFETVNGSITLDLPTGINAEFRANTVNGRIDTDFPITVTGQVNRRSLRGTIGQGGPELRASTVNGSIRLREI